MPNETKVDELISLIQWPTAHSPWSTMEPGDSYVWEDYVLLFQVRPLAIADGMMAITKSLNKDKSPLVNQGVSAINYHYSLTVFYRRHINPSARPVRLFGLEQVCIENVRSDIRKSMPESMPPMVGEFTATNHINHGEYSKPIEYKEVRKTLLDCARRSLQITGEPEWIGTVEDAMGHPKTGIPTIMAKTSPKTGCLSCVLLTCGTAVTLLVSLRWS